MTINRDQVTVRGHEKMGVGRTPYALSPNHHKELMNIEEFDYGEGTVVYEESGGLRLPKHLYFEKTVNLEEPIETVRDVEKALDVVLNVSIDVKSLV